MALDVKISVYPYQPHLVLVYTLNSHLIPPCSSVTDLGINVQFDLKPGVHCAQIASKANARSKLILKTFLSRDPLIITKAFVTYVRPLLEYCTPVWSPHNIGSVDLIENVQRTFTRKLFHLCRMQHVTYDERLAFLGLERLELRRIHADLLFMFNYNS